MRRSFHFKLVLVAAGAAAALTLSTGCDKVMEMVGQKAAEPEAEPAATAPAADEAAPAAEPSAEDKQRYVKASVDLACANGKAANDPAKVMENTQRVLEEHGFDQASFAQASSKFASDPEVAKEIAAKTQECLSAAATAAAADSAPAGAADGETKERYIKASVALACANAAGKADAAQVAQNTQRILKEHGFDQASFAQAATSFANEAEVVQAIAAKSAECLQGTAAADADATAEGGDQAAAAEQGDEAKAEEAAGDEAKAEEGTAEEQAAADQPAEDKPKASPLTGKWVGNMMGSHTGIIEFKVQPNGKKVTNGRVKSTGSKSFHDNFFGEITGKRVILNGRGGAANIMFNGNINIKGRNMKGAWRGTINNKAANGTWSASRVD